MMGKYDTVGQDIVNHCCDDLLAMGAKSLTFLDYVAHDKLDPIIMADMVAGMAKACRDNGVSLIGGETAEMPGVYMKGEHDIAGCITGVVEKDGIITGEKIQEGDILIGLPSSGLHTNGFSLARKILFDIAGHDVNTVVDELGESVGEALLKVHVNYSVPVLEMLANGTDIRGIAHITGGGFIENIPRVLPESLDAEINLNTWPMLPIFPYMQKVGNVEQNEMYRVFNMGIGLILVVPQSEKGKVESTLAKYPEFKMYEIGRIIKGEGKVVLR
jgi:phosphoribosylformylglycinamidine cyclo-ligase